MAWFLPYKYTKSQIQDETFPKIIHVLNIKGTSKKNYKKAMLTSAKLMAFNELENGEKYAIVQSSFEYNFFCVNIQIAAGKHYTKTIYTSKCLS